MNTTQNTKTAADVKVGDMIRVSYINRDSKDQFERMTIQLDADGFATLVTRVRDRALVGKGMMIQVQQGVFKTVLPTDIVTLGA